MGGVDAKPRKAPLPLREAVRAVLSDIAKDAKDDSSSVADHAEEINELRSAMDADSKRRRAPGANGMHATRTRQLAVAHRNRTIGELRAIARSMHAVGMTVKATQIQVICDRIQEILKTPLPPSQEEMDAQEQVIQDRVDDELTKRLGARW